MKKVAATMTIALFLLFLLGSPLVAQDALTNDSVIKLTKVGISDETILNLIKIRPAEFQLGIEELLALKDAGVSDKVINAMVLSGQRKLPQQFQGQLLRTHSWHKNKLPTKAPVFTLKLVVKWWSWKEQILSNRKYREVFSLQGKIWGKRLLFHSLGRV